MPLIPKKPADFESPEPGTYLAICYQVIDLGTQTIKFKGEDKKTHQVRMTWELPHEHMKDGRPFSVSKTYTLSLSKNAHLRADLEAWRAKAFTDEELGNVDLVKLLGHPALLTIIKTEKDGKSFTNVETVAKMMKGTEPPGKPYNMPVALILTPEEFDRKTFDGLSDFLKKKIEVSPEYQAIVSGKPMDQGQVADDDLNDEIPF